MDTPLSEPQQRLRGRNVADLTDDQLRDWIDGCKAMELSAKDGEELRAWRQSRQEAEAALAAREVPTD